MKKYLFYVGIKGQLLIKDNTDIPYGSVGCQGNDI